MANKKPLKAQAIGIAADVYKTPKYEELLKAENFTYKYEPVQVGPGRQVTIIKVDCTPDRLHILNRICEKVEQWALTQKN